MVGNEGMVEAGRGECGESGIRGDGIGGEAKEGGGGAGRGAVVNLWTYFSRRAVAINPAL